MEPKRLLIVPWFAGVLAIGACGDDANTNIEDDALIEEEGGVLQDDVGEGVGVGADADDVPVAAEQVGEQDEDEEGVP